MRTTSLTQEQTSIVNALWTLINNLDDNVRLALAKKLKASNMRASSAQRAGSKAKQSSSKQGHDVAQKLSDLSSTGQGTNGLLQLAHILPAAQHSNQELLEQYLLEHHGV